MSLLLTDQSWQLIAWFIVLFYSIIGLYCLVIDFGQLLNRFVFVFAISVAVHYWCVALLVTTGTYAGVVWLSGPVMLLEAVQEPLLVIMTLILLKPQWWRGPWRWYPRPVIGLSLILPLIILSDVLFGTDFYYAGIDPELTQNGYLLFSQYLPGNFFPVLHFIHFILVPLLILGFALYVGWFDHAATRLTRWLARLILSSVAALLLLMLLLGNLIPALVATILAGVIAPIGFVIAIFLQIFSENPFRKGSLQTRLPAVVLATAIPILIAVGLLARRSEQAFWSGLIFGIVILYGLIHLTIRYSIRPIHTLIQTATAITAGDLDRTAPLESKDEIGLLAAAFNNMTEQLRSLIQELEQRVASRTQELERRATQLETMGRIGQYVISILDQKILLSEVVNRIQNDFGYDFVGVWLVDEANECLKLQVQAQSEAADSPVHDQPLKASDPGLVVLAWQERGPQFETLTISDQKSQINVQRALPLFDLDEVIGILDVRSLQPDALVQDDQFVLQMLTDEIAIALQNARLYQTEQTRRRLAEALQQVSRELSSSLDIRQIPGLILEQLAIAVPYERCALMLQHGAVLQVAAQRGFPEANRALDLQVSIQEGDIYQQIIASERPVRLDNVMEDPTWQQVDWLPVDLSWLGVPLTSKDGVIGMISLTRAEAHAFSEEDAQLASAFSGHAAIALENARLYEEISALNEGLEQTVTERTEALNQAYQTLERLDKTKSDFINVMAHELRTPLTVIRGYAQVLSKVDEAHAQDGASQEMLAGVLSGVERLQEIVDNMLDVAKIEHEALDLQKEATSLERLVRQAEQRLSDALQTRQIRLLIENLAHLPPIQADPDLLYKVFYHLPQMSSY